MFRRRTPDDFSEEVQAHLDLETDRLVAEGWPRAAARDAALKAFGNVTRAKERFHEASRWTWLEQLAQDLRYAWRGLRHSPAFLTATVLTLAVGLGLVSVAFTVFNAYFLRPYAVRDPGSLHQIGWRSPGGGGGVFRWREYEAIRDRRDLFSAAVAEHTRFVSSNGRPLAAALVSDNYFEALAPAMVLGRGLGRIDAGAASGMPAVLSDQAWGRLFSRDPAALGRPMDVSGRTVVIVGIVAPQFTGLGDSPRDLWMPFTAYAATASPDLIAPGQPRSVEILARPLEGVPAAQVQAALTPFMAGVAQPESNVRADVRRRPSPNPLTLRVLAVLSPVFAAFALVLVTACANVSNVMLARAIARQREIAVRLSIGATRGRVVRQLLTEGLLIAVLAGIAGLALAAWILRAGLALVSGTLPPSVADIVRLVPVTIDHRVFLFALGVSTAATVLFALLPALQASRLTLTGALRGHGAGTARGSTLRNALVAGQVAVSIVLVIVAVTIARNGMAIGAVDLGYDARGVISVNVREDGDRLVAGLADVLASEPRVGEVAVTGGNPLFIRERPAAAAPAGAGTAIPTRYTFVSPEYFSILRIPIARGRGFRADEARSASRVAVVSAATAAAFWPGADPIGRTIRIEPAGGRPVDDLPGYSEVTVIGTVRDVVSGMLFDGPDAGHIYLPMTARHPQARALLMRGRTDGSLDPRTLHEIFAKVGRDPQVFEALPLEEMRALQLYPLRAASWVGAFLGAVALVLSVSGLYGVLTYTLNQRTREIGIRIALGASARAVVGLVMRQSARLAGIGALAGGLVAFGALQALSAAIQLDAITLVDLAAFGAGLTLVLAATALAAYRPALRASRVDPATTLRADG